MTIPKVLEPYADRKVRVVAKYGEPELWALIDIISGGQHAFDLGGYKETLRAIDSCEMSIKDWTNAIAEGKVGT